MYICTVLSHFNTAINAIKTSIIPSSIYLHSTGEWDTSKTSQNQTLYHSVFISIFLFLQVCYSSKLTVHQLWTLFFDFALSESPRVFLLFFFSFSLHLSALLVTRHSFLHQKQPCHYLARWYSNKQIIPFTQHSGKQQRYYRGGTNWLWMEVLYV